MSTNKTIDGVPRECRECGSTALSWFAQNTVSNGIQQNRLNTSDVQCVFVLGCDDCSETLKIISADKIAEHFNKPAAQPVAGLPRELLERILSYTWFPNPDVDVTALDLRLTDREKLCDLLGSLLVSDSVNWKAVANEQMGIIQALKAAQPQGEPVAWLAQAIGKDGEVYRSNASTTETTMRDVRFAWGQSVIDRFTIVIKPLYAEQPAPVAAPKCERCKGWGFRDDPETGIDAGCGTCNGTGKEPID